MSKIEKEILSHFVAGEVCSEEELKLLKEWLDSENTQGDVDELLRFEWEKNNEKETAISFGHIQNQLKKIDLEKKNVIPVYRRVLINYQRIAAILLLPLMVFSGYFLLNGVNKGDEFFVTSALKGQKSSLILPDGTKVWLNSDSQIKYTSDFGKRNRTVQLTGEAYLEVTKNPKKPFLVQTANAEIKVLGTTFNVKAYPDEDEIETSLLEGKIELTVFEPTGKEISKTIEMRPGESLIFNNRKNELRYNNFKNDEITGWRNNQLIFRNDSFDNLVKKIERWYDVEIIYDETKFKDQRLTVELYQGERLDRLIEIIELAISVECKTEGNKIYINAKK